MADTDGLSTHDLLVEIRADVKRLTGFMDAQVALKLDDRLCELEERRIPRMERWQWRIGGAVSVVGIMLGLVSAWVAGGGKVP